MNDQCPNFQKEKVYDLEERTAKFGESLVGTLRKLPKDCINDRLIKQAVGSGRSLGGLIIVKQMKLKTQEILFIKYQFVKKRQKKQFIG